MRPENGRLLRRLRPETSLHSPSARHYLPTSRRTSGSLRPTPQACRRCSLPSDLRHRSRFYSDTSASAAKREGQPGPSFTPLTTRSLLAVTGRDAASFLQGLTTNSIPFEASDQDGNAHEPPAGLYTAFLNAQGRLLQDAFIYELPRDSSFWKAVGIEADGSSSSTSPGFLIEADVSQAVNLSKSLRRYRLRSKVSISRIDASLATIVSVWDTNAGGEASLNLIRKLHLAGAYCRRDERAPHFGYRAIVPADAVTQLSEAKEASPDQYRLRRYLHGIPEGQAELPYEGSLVHDSDLDYMHAVDFRKGCYVGQELVIRTQHTGVVRKRILPVALYSSESDAPFSLLPDSDDAQTYPTLPYGTDIKKIGDSDTAGRRNRSAGKWIANIGNVGLAHARLEVVAGIGPVGDRIEGWQRPELGLDTSEEGGRTDLRVKAFVPEWWEKRRAIKAP